MFEAAVGEPKLHRNTCARHRFDPNFTSRPTNAAKREASHLNTKLLAGRARSNVQMAGF